MIKYKYLLISIFLPLLAAVLLFSLDRGKETAVAALANGAALCEVETEGDGDTDFTSADASALQAAVDSVVAGAFIKVSGTCAGVQAQGGFTQTVFINKSITIQGGYTSTNWLAPSDPVTYPTILDAQQGGRVVYMPNGFKTVVLDGLTITGGDGAGGNGGGIFVGTGVQWVLTNSTVNQNTSSSFGGGIYNQAAHFAMSNSTLANNTAVLNGGGGLYVTGPVVVNITSSTVQENSASRGGGIRAQNSATITIDDSVIQNNHADIAGGGVAGDSATVIMNITNSTIASNVSADEGGGIWNNGTLTLGNSTVMDNEAVDDGGGLLNNFVGEATITNSIFENNRVQGALTSRGAGIYNRTSGIVTLQTSTLRQNSAEDNGGGIWNQGTFTIESSTVESNTSDLDGGGIWNDGNLTINSSNILSNSVPLDGGGIHNTAELNINNSTLAYNEANDGGGIYSTGLMTVTTVSISGSTIHDNQAVIGAPPNRGGGIYINSGQASIINSTLSRNMSANEGGALVNSSIVDLIHTTVASNSNLDNTGVGTGLYNLNAAAVMTLTNTAVAYNSGLVPDTDCGGVPGSVLVDNGYNLVQDGTCITAGTSFSGDPLLGSLANNGGGTQTHLPLPFSPLIDSIPAASCAAADDQIGVARPVDGACDIGSVELAVNYGPPTAVNDDYTTDEDVALVVTAPGVLANDLDGDFGPLTAVLDADVVSGTLLLNSDGSFSYTPDANFCGTDSFTYHANDGLTNSNVATVTLNVTCMPDLPVAVNDTYAVDADTPLTVPAPGVLGNDSDADGDVLTAVLDANVMTGTLTLDSDGSFTYTPLIGWVGVVTFTYHAEAGGDSSNIAVVTLLVGVVNVAPVAVDDSYTTDEDTALNVAAPGVLANDSDDDGDPLTAILDEDVTTGTLTFNSDGSFDYMPPLNWSGVTTFTYYANDGLFNSNTAVVTITVEAVNDAPTAVADNYTATEDLLLTVNAPGVLANDSDVDGDSLTAMLVSGVASGSLTLNSDGSFDYMPNADFCGADSFTYQANDGQANSNVVTVTLNVTCTPDAPVAVDDNYSTPQNTPLVIAAPGILGNDSDADGDSLTAVLDSGVLTGTLDFNNDGSFTYTPLAGWSGETTFTYHANDGALNSNTAVVTIIVSGANNPPEAEDDNYSTPQNTPLVVAAPGVLDNDSDVDGDSLTAVLNTGVTNGSLTFNSDGSFTYTPNPGFVGIDTFTYTVSDGALTDTATVTITVEPESETGFAIYLPFVVKAP